MTAACRSAALMLALAAMLLRGLLPAGWMPNTAGASGTPFVICTIGGPLHQAPHHGLDKSGDGSLCPFAATAHLAPPQMAVAVAAPGFAGIDAALPSAKQASEQTIHTAYRPRGPPIRA